MIKKLLLLPRAMMDLATVWKEQLSIRQKSSLTYTLAVLKWRKWQAPENAIVSFPLLGYQWHGVNNSALQFLIKEVFIDQVYRMQVQQPVKTIADIGANIGLASLYFHINYPDATVQAFEPNSSSFELLQQNVKANGIKNVEALNVAVGADEKVLYRNAGFEAFSINQSFSAAGNGDSVNAVSVVDLIRQEKPDVIKLDIEGMEYEVLQAAIEEGLLAKVKCWMIEFHDARKTATYVKAFEKAGFRFELVQNIYHFKSVDI